MIYKKCYNSHMNEGLISDGQKELEKQQGLEKIDENLESPEPLSPQEQEKNLIQNITETNDGIKSLEASVSDTQAKLDTVRGDLGMPQSTEDPPSIRMAKGKLTSLQNNRESFLAQQKELTGETAVGTPPVERAVTETTSEWKGNWQGGERPEGYKGSDERYVGLKSKGFSATENLGQDFVTKYNKLMTKARSGIGLNREELAQLQENNSRFHTVMDEFEKSSPNRQENKVEQPEKAEVHKEELDTYDSSLHDPDIFEVQDKISGRIRNEITQIQAGTWGELAREGNYEERARKRIEMDEWDDFIKNNPDKAEKYKDKISDIRNRLEIKDRSQGQQQANEAYRQNNQKKLDEKIESWKKENPQASESVDEFKKRLDDKIGVMIDRAPSSRESVENGSIGEIASEPTEKILKKTVIQSETESHARFTKEKRPSQKFSTDESLQVTASDLEGSVERAEDSGKNIPPSESFDISASRVEENEGDLVSAINRISGKYEHNDQNFDLSDLDHEKYIAGSTLGETLREKGADLGTHIIPTKLVAGSLSPAFEAWRDEYADRPGRIVETAKNLREGDTTELQRIFSTFNKEKMIKLKRIAGPSGDFFIAQDGTHRIASAKLAEIPDILANVEDQKLPESLETSDGTMIAHWEDLLKLGLIEGEIRNDEKETDKRRLEIKQIKIPWALSKWADFAKINNFYQGIYPRSFEGSSIPKEVLLDESGIAKNYWINGRWQEYSERLEKK